MPTAVEILSVGNELLLGNTINTNAAWIATQVTSAGAEVRRITTIGDNLPDISSEIRSSLQRRPGFLIVTGGIGPTFDDMTLKGVAKGLGRKVRTDPVAVKMIRIHYARRFGGKPMQLTKARVKMAQIPQGSVPVPNPVGTAPAVLSTVGQTEIFCLPGVPSEAKAIFLASILERIRAKARGRAYVEIWLRINGIFESSLAPIIDRVMARTPTVYIKSHPRGIENNRANIELHFSTFASSRPSGLGIIRKSVSQMRKELRGRNVRIKASKTASWNAD